MERKSLDRPDETRPFKDGKGKLEVVTVGDRTFGRGIFEPGWRWSEHVKPIAGTPSCQAAHTGYVLEGRMVVKMDDGTQVEYGPGDAFYMPPGHDAWIVGDKRCVLIDFTGVAKYAKPAWDNPKTRRGWRWGPKTREEDMSRKFIDCREFPSQVNCTIALSADSEAELLEAAVQHAVAVHGHQDTPDLRAMIRSAMKDGTPPLAVPGRAA
jgi:quercetin dioxygenase-like cupin family protein/predicted small metal-binding protein